MPRWGFQVFDFIEHLVTIKEIRFPIKYERLAEKHPTYLKLENLRELSVWKDSTEQAFNFFELCEMSGLRMRHCRKLVIDAEPERFFCQRRLG